MITGFNTDVEYDGRVFHVQTEDKGRGNPVVETLVYTGGEIVTTRRTSYKELANSDSFSEAELLKRMEAQHRILLQEIASGRLDPEGPKPFGYNIITNRSFDEVVREFLAERASAESIRIELAGHPALVEGTQPAVTLQVFSGSEDRPVAAATVIVKLLSTTDKPKELFRGATDPEGQVAAAFDLPSSTEASFAILCQAEEGGRSAEVKQLVLKQA